MGCCQTVNPKAGQAQEINLKEDSIYQNSKKSPKQVESPLEDIHINLSQKQAKFVEVKEVYQEEVDKIDEPFLIQQEEDRKIEQDKNDQKQDQQKSQEQLGDTKQKKNEFVIKQDYFVKQNAQSKNYLDYYHVMEFIGQGGYGKVYKVQHKSTGMIRAMKIILKDKLKPEEQNKLLEETQLLIQMDHPNIVKLFEIFQDDQSYYLVNEYCDGGELFEKVRVFKSLNERQVASYFKQILSATHYCHNMKIVHRDLKPENILFDSKKDTANIKIIDFGASAKLDVKLEKKIGTPFYVAPEVLAGSYNEKCDIWSIGVMLYVLLCGYPPFFAPNEREVLQKVKKGVYEFDPNDWSKISSQAKELVRKMLHYEPKLRLSAKEAYNHPWVNNKEKNDLNNRVLQRLSNFQMKNKLKMAIFEFISVQVMTSHEKQELMRNFQSIDANGDGQVSKNELYQAYKKYYKDSLKAREIVDEIFKDMDANNSGKVDFSGNIYNNKNINKEFVAATINKQKTLSKKRMEQSFKLFDLDGNGLITKDEIEELFGVSDLDDQMWKQILDECDKNGDGMVYQQLRSINLILQISQGEFIDLLAIQIQRGENIL